MKYGETAPDGRVRQAKSAPTDPKTGEKDVVGSRCERPGYVANREAKPYVFIDGYPAGGFATTAARSAAHVRCRYCTDGRSWRCDCFKRHKCPNQPVDVVKTQPKSHRSAGLPPLTWVCCDRAACGKWRVLPAGAPVPKSGEKFYCDRNPHRPGASCKEPQDAEEETTAPHVRKRKRQ